MEKLVLTPNVPQQVSLKFQEGRKVEGRYGDQMMFTLANGQVMYLDLDDAAKIDTLQLRRGEAFWVCKRWTGRKGDRPQFDAFRLEGTSPAAITGIPPTEVEIPQTPQPQRQLASYPGTGAVTPAPAATAASQPPYSNGNGNSNGHANGGANGNNGQANGHNGHAVHNGITYWDAKAELLRCYDDAIDVLVSARDRATAKGLPVQFTGDDLRQVAATLFINSGKDRRTDLIQRGGY